MKPKNAVLLACCVLLAGLTPIIPIASATTFEIVSPFSMTYSFPDDYKLFTVINPGSFPSDPGDVTAALQYVGDGNESTDYASFVSGNIALIERGGTLFSAKVSLAESFGAVGAIIFDYGIVYPDVTHSAETFIPSIFTTNEVGIELQSLLISSSVPPYSPIIAHLEVSGASTVAEPMTTLLLGLGLMGVAAVRRKRFKK